MRVLIVNDDAVIRHQFEAALDRAGIEVTAVSEGFAAWEILRRGDTPRVLVLDWGITGVTSDVILKRLRDDASRPYVFVILTSARAAREDLTQAFELGADQHLLMPADGVELRARVQAGMRVIARMPPAPVIAEKPKWRAA